MGKLERCVKARADFSPTCLRARARGKQGTHGLPHCTQRLISGIGCRRSGNRKVQFEGARSPERNYDLAYKVLERIAVRSLLRPAPLEEVHPMPVTHLRTYHAPWR